MNTNSETEKNQVLLDIAKKQFLEKSNEKKYLTLKIANLYRNIGNEKRSKKILYCGTQLVFAPIDSTLKLISGNFCQARLCPMCSWRKSKRISSNLFKILEQDEHKNKRFLFVTLTIKNCSGADLSATIDTLLSGWRKLTMNKNKLFRVVFSGILRALEVTYNCKTNEYHPHLHALCEVSEEYFKNKNEYLTHEELKLAWQKAIGSDYEPYVYIEAVKDEVGQVCEMSKYVVKTTDIENEEVLKVLDSSLENRRLLSYHDSLKDTKRRLRLEDERLQDVDKRTAENIFNNPAIKKIICEWHFGANVYEVKRIH